MTKIATRIKNAVTGEEYYIGTTGLQENVSVKLTAPQLVDWTQYNVAVQNISKGTSQTIALNEFGRCSFAIPMGEMYEVQLPIVGEYTQPVAQTFSATQVERTIEHAYSTEPLQYEQVDIEAYVNSISGDTHSILDGMVVYAKDTNNDTYMSTFQDGYATIRIPYGKHYTLFFPMASGYFHDHTGEEHTSGLVSREVLVNYYEEGYGVYGVLADGTKLLPEEITEQIAAGTIVADDIIAGYYNDSYLANADRGDGTIGCGFMWRITNPTTTGPWADPLVNVSTDLMPYRKKGSAALQDCKGKHNTRIMDEVITGAGSVTIAHTLRTSTSYVLTINGVDRQGFLPAYGQIKRLEMNRAYYEALYTAIGKTAPKIWNDFWWSSCQFDDKYAVFLAYGNFYEGGYFKNNYYNVLVCYDL